MEVNDFSPVDHSIDYEKILPIQQKRIIAFINHFITNTVSFLNTFAQSCESRLMEFEYKIQKVEASLLILESQLSSIASLNNIEDSKVVVNTTLPTDVINQTDTLILPEVTPEDVPSSTTIDSPVVSPRACEDSRFIRFFKMVQFGVPAAAVKHKMQAEGLDSSILDKPNDVVPGYVTDITPDSSSSS